MVMGILFKCMRYKVHIRTVANTGHGIRNKDAFSDSKLVKIFYVTEHLCAWEEAKVNYARKETMFLENNFISL